MTKILIIPEYTERGGARTYAESLIRYYSNRQYDIHVALPVEDQNGNLSMDCSKYSSLKIYRLQKRWKGYKKIWRLAPLSFILDFILVYNIYRKIKPDLIVISNVFPESFMGLAILKTPFICIQHTYHMNFNPFGSRFKSLKHLYFILNNWFLNKLLKSHTKRIIAVSSFSRDLSISTYGLKEENVMVIHNHADKTDLKSRNKTDISKMMILTIGHVRTYKNPVLWIRVAEKVIQTLPDKNIEFQWVGDGELLDECIRMIKEAKLESQVRFTGFNPNVSQYYTESDIYFQPSLIESHGIAVVEAMAYALPCVVSNIGGLPESVVDGINGITVSPDNVDEMANAIIELIENEGLRIKMGTESLKRFKENFTYEIWEQKMNKLNDQLLA